MTETVTPASARRAEPSIDRDVLLGIYATMRRIVTMDAAVQRALASGAMATAYYPVRGLEAVCACIGEVLSPDDYLVSTYRCLGDVIAKGVSCAEIVAEMSGRLSGTSKGKGGSMHMSDPRHGLMATTGIVGGGLPIANGLALASMLRADGRATVVTFGDGATSIGAYHESLHLAALWNLPVVFVCQNNQWGEHTSLDAYTKEPDLARRASVYLIESAAVDGFDPPRTYEALRSAVARARAGAGPTFLECQTYRLGPHAFGNEVSYMPLEEREAAIEREPVPRFRDTMLHGGTASSAELDRIDRQIEAEVEEAFAVAQASPPTPEEELLTDLFAGDQGAITQ
jgi:TPP-dependent pyruvate/acetoin dehydrogenase alpha subunit